MNAFFASVEQRDHPEWRGKPVVVTNGELGTCIITCSYEARKYGIKTGMRLREAKQRCPYLVHAPSRPEIYAQVSMQIMEALQQVTPDIEIFSIDEAFLDITKCQNIYSSPVEAAKLVKEIIFKTSELTCSVGLSGDKTTAKFAAERQKPNGFTVIPPWESQQALANTHVTELCGINHGVARFLAQYDAIYCKDVAKLPIHILAKRFGNVGRRLWLMCQGKDPEPVHTTIAPPKSVGHGKVLPPNTNEIEIIKTYFRHMAEKVASRLRKYQMVASIFFIGMRSNSWGWIGYKFRAPYDNNSGGMIYNGCKKLLAQYPEPGTIRQVQITALDPRANVQQLDLFENDKITQTNQLETIVDHINQKFGDFAVMPATLINRTTMPKVIAPAWRPTGCRKTV